MQTKTRAIVLHSFKYGESQMIVDLFTASCGRQSCIIKIPKSSKGKLKKQYFQPLFILDTVLDIRQRSRLQHISEARVAVPFTSIPFNPYKLSISMFIAEFLRCATRCEQIDEIAFDYIESSLRWLDGRDDKFANFHLVFIIRLSRFLGFYPNMDDYRPGDWFDMRTGCFCSLPPLHHDRLAPEEAKKIGLLLRMNFPTMHLFRMTRTERNRLVEVIMSYYRIHIPDFPELKSHGVLQELFRNDDE